MYGWWGECVLFLHQQEPADLEEGNPESMLTGCHTGGINLNHILRLGNMALIYLCSITMHMIHLDILKSSKNHLINAMTG